MYSNAINRFKIITIVAFLLSTIGTFIGGIVLIVQNSDPLRGVSELVLLGVLLLSLGPLISFIAFSITMAWIQHMLNVQDIHDKICGIKKNDEHSTTKKNDEQTSTDTHFYTHF